MSAKLGSRNLAMLAEHLDEDPFVKVKKMVRDLIWKLKEEATAETEQKGWCTAELKSNKVHIFCFIVHALFDFSR